MPGKPVGCGSSLLRGWSGGFLDWAPCELLGRIKRSLGGREGQGGSWVGSACEELAGRAQCPGMGQCPEMAGEPVWGMNFKDATIRRMKYGSNLPYVKTAV